MPSPPATQSCATCFFYQEGACKFNAPVLVGGVTNIWPSIAPDDWCGDWSDAAKVHATQGPTGPVGPAGPAGEIGTTQLTSDGFWFLPSGLIIQWGTCIGTTVTFPIPFSNALFTLALDATYSSPASCVVANSQVRSQTGFTAAVYTITSGSVVPASVSSFRWIAIGF